MFRNAPFLSGAVFISVLFVTGTLGFADNLADVQKKINDSIAVSTPTSAGIQLAKYRKRGEVPGGIENWERGEEVVVLWGDEPTKVKIIGNLVLVPVTLAHDGNEIDVHLVLDTGSTGTLINTEIANQLFINLNQARKKKVQVVGGEILEARVVRITSLTIGPHTKSNWDVLVVPHKGSVARHDGLLGMDVLRGLKYHVDFKKQVIVWQ